MGILTTPNDSVAKFVTMPRWQRSWINSHKSLNFSGLCQEMVIRIIKETDPEYYKKHEKYLLKKLIRKEEIIEEIASKIKI